MADSKQLRILKRLTEVLEGINPDNANPATGDPFTFDLRDKVVRGVSVLPADEAENKLSILEYPRQELFEPVGRHGIIRKEEWMLMLQGWPTNDPQNPSDPAYAMKAEVEAQLATILSEKPNGRGPTHPENYMLKIEGKPQIMTLMIAPGVVRPPEDAASRLAMFYLPLVIGVKVNVADPYSSEGD
jgi:hypothetical protein